MDRSILNVESLVESGQWNFCFLSDCSLDQQAELAFRISKMTRNEPTVLNLTAEEVLEKECVALLFDGENGELISVCAMSKPFLNQFGMMVGEIGTMFTAEKYQRQGAASFLVKKIDDWASKNPQIDGAYAFLNNKSPFCFAVNDYSGKALIRNWTNEELELVSAEDFVPQKAVKFRQDARQDSDEQELIRAKSKIQELRQKVDSERANLFEMEEYLLLTSKLTNAKSEKTRRFRHEISKEINKIDEIWKAKPERIHSVLAPRVRIIELYEENLKNDLHYLDVLVAKSYRF